MPLACASRIHSAQGRGSVPYLGISWSCGFASGTPLRHRHLVRHKWAVGFLDFDDVSARRLPSAIRSLTLSEDGYLHQPYRSFRRTNRYLHGALNHLMARRNGLSGSGICDCWSSRTTSSLPSSWPRACKRRAMEPMCCLVLKKLVRFFERPSMQLSSWT